MLHQISNSTEMVRQIQALHLVFSLNEGNKPHQKDQIVHEELVYFWPTFKSGDIISLAKYDMENTDLDSIDTKRYTVIKAEYVVMVNTSGSPENLNHHSLMVSLQEVTKKQVQVFPPSFA